MNTKNRFLTAIIAVVVVIVGWTATVQVQRNNATPTPVATATPTANPQLVSVTASEGKTALASLKEQATVETKQFSFGEMVQSINGLVADDAHYWGFYVNGELASVGAGDYTAKSGDRIEFRYEKL